MNQMIKLVTKFSIQWITTENERMVMTVSMTHLNSPMVMHTGNTVDVLQYYTLGDNYYRL